MQCPSQLPIEASDPVSESAVGGWRLSEESEEGQDCSSMSSVWSSAVLERESPGLSQGEAWGSQGDAATSLWGPSVPLLFSAIQQHFALGQQKVRAMPQGIYSPVLATGGGNRGARGREEQGQQLHSVLFWYRSPFPEREGDAPDGVRPPVLPTAPDHGAAMAAASHRQSEARKSLPQEQYAAFCLRWGVCPMNHLVPKRRVSWGFCALWGEGGRDPASSCTEARYGPCLDGSISQATHS